MTNATWSWLWFVIECGVIGWIVAKLAFEIYEYFEDQD